MKRVLVIDDEPQIRRLLEIALGSKGFEVYLAATGIEGREAVQTVRPDIVLLDLVMPGLSGKGLIQALRSGKKGDALKIIVTTASVSEFERVSAEELGADALIDKPVMEGLLFAEIKRLTDIEYDFEDSADRSTGDPRISATKADLTGRITALPAEIFVKLRDSIKLGDIEEIQGAAEKIAEFDPELAAAISTMAENFQMDRLIKFADSVG